MAHPTDCPFCTLPEPRIVTRNSLAAVIRDAFPVSPGHTLIIPKRHVASFFDMTPDERQAVFGLLEEAKRQLDVEFTPSAYNIGINEWSGRCSNGRRCACPPDSALQRRPV